jgi:hypothetical protein
MPNWYPGQNAQGQKVEASVFGMARGFWSQPPTITTPGTPVASGSAVANSTGLDCMVYMSSTTGIGKILVGAGTISTGSTVSASNAMAGGIYVPAGQTITVTYTGTFTWTWLAV